MKKYQALMAVLAVMAIIYAAPSLAAEEAAAGAAPAPTLPIGVIDMGRILQATDAAKGIFTELEGKRKEYQAQIEKEEKTLRASEQEILKQKETLSKEEFDKKRKGFEEKLVSAQKMVQEKKRMLDQVYGDSMNKLRDRATEVIAQVAKEKGLAVVLTEDSVVLAVQSMSITEEVVSRMNKSVKKIPVEWSPKSGKTGK